MFNAKSLLIVALLFLCSCSSGTGFKSVPAPALLSDGVIVLSRPAPMVSNVSGEISALGFLPVQAAPSGVWLAINSAGTTLSLMDGDKVLSSVSGEGIQKIKPGEYKLMHKQRSALWYAPDSYFSARNLPVPPQGDRLRFRRGALGDFVLFINKETPIHSGPIWLDEIGGIRMNENDISRIYYRLPVGATIEVK